MDVMMLSRMLHWIILKIMELLLKVVFHIPQLYRTAIVNVIPRQSGYSLKISQSIRHQKTV